MYMPWVGRARVSCRSWCRHQCTAVAAQCPLAGSVPFKFWIGIIRCPRSAQHSGSGPSLSVCNSESRNTVPQLLFTTATASVQHHNFYLLLLLLQCSFTGGSPRTGLSSNWGQARGSHWGWLGPGSRLYQGSDRKSETVTVAGNVRVGGPGFCLFKLEGATLQVLTG
jgi:hypothetical protein